MLRRTNDPLTLCISASDGTIGDARSTTTVWSARLIGVPCVLRTAGFALGTARRLIGVPSVPCTAGFALGTARRLMPAGRATPGRVDG